MISDGLAPLVGAGLKAEHQAAVVVGDGQWVAPRSVAEEEVAFKRAGPRAVHLPEVVGGLGLEVGVGPRRRLRGEATVAAEDAGDGGGGWGTLSELALKDCVELAPTPGGVLVAEADDVGLDLRWCAGGAGMGPSGTVGEGVRTPVAVASDPFVAGGAGYAEAPAEASDVGVGMGGKEDDSLRRNMAVVVFQGMTDEASGVAKVSTMSSCICLLCLPPIHAKEGSYPNSPSVPRRREPIQHFS